MSHSQNRICQEKSPHSSALELLMSRNALTFSKINISKFSEFLVNVGFFLEILRIPETRTSVISAVCDGTSYLMVSYKIPTKKVIARRIDRSFSLMYVFCFINRLKFIDSAAGSNATARESINYEKVSSGLDIVRRRPLYLDVQATTPMVRRCYINLK